MKTHLEPEEDWYALSKCGTFDIGDEFASLDETPTCIECRFFDDVQEAWEQYVMQPSNFGRTDPETVFAERDAFFAGAFALASKTVPF